VKLLTELLLSILAKVSHFVVLKPLASGVLSCATVQLAVLRWVQVRIKTFGFERQEFSHRSENVLVTSLCVQLFVLLNGVFFVPFSHKASIDLIYSGSFVL